MIHGGRFPGRAPSVMPLLILLDQFAQLLLQPVLLWLLTCQLWSCWLLGSCQLLCHLLSLQAPAKSKFKNLLYYIYWVAASCNCVCGFAILLRGLAMLCYAMLCYAMLCYAMLRCDVMCCAMLGWAALSYVLQKSACSLPPHIPTKIVPLLVHHYC